MKYDEYNSVRSDNQSFYDEIVRFVMESRNYSFEQDISNNQDLTIDYMHLITKRKGVEFNDRKFKTLGLINKDNLFTSLGLLVSD